MLATLSDPRQAKAGLETVRQSVMEAARSPSALGRNLWEHAAAGLGSGDEAPSAASRHLTNEEHWRGMAARILFSPWFRYYLGVMIVINLFALCFSFYEPHRAPRMIWFISLEFFLTLSLLLELLLRVQADGPCNLARGDCNTCKFCRSRSNVFDLFVVFLSMVSLATFFLPPTMLEMLEEDAAMLIRCVRDFIRLLRLMFLIKNHRQSTLPLDEVSLVRAQQIDLGSASPEGLMLTPLARPFQFEEDEAESSQSSPRRRAWQVALAQEPRRAILGAEDCCGSSGFGVAALPPWSPLSDWSAGSRLPSSEPLTLSPPAHVLLQP